MPAEDIHIIEQELHIDLIAKSEFDRVRGAALDRFEKLILLADMARANTLAAVKLAGSGHLGSSLSAMDIVTWLYFDVMNVGQVGIETLDRDVYFSSKGHDVPGLYAVLYALGIIPEERFLKLRRFGGLDGHPDVGVPGIEANSGSLGMGISKGKGIALAKRINGFASQVYVLTGDGEWQEGQNFEALQSAAQHKVGNLTVIIDNNKVQSDKYVADIVALGDLEAKLSAFGWHVARCDGHDYRALDRVFADFATIHHQPKLLIADTIKGRGVSFMEHPFAMQHGNGLYPWHAGAPDDEAYLAAHREILLRIEDRLREAGLDGLQLAVIPPHPKVASGVTSEYVAMAYGEALTQQGAQRRDLVVLDADLAADCRIRGFEAAYPQRFFEMGIAEQDMVSTAAGMARHGFLPVVNSFASFLAARANEQIYNAATEKRKIIYACHYAGLIPAGPGKSHQSLRDISLFGALPDHVVLQPCNAAETHMVVDYCINEAAHSCVIRLIIGPSPRHIELPADYRLQFGQGLTLRDGDAAVLFAYGPVMLHEALLASEQLAAQGVGLQIVNMPWLNRVDRDWLKSVVARHQHIFVVDDHSPVGGLGDALLNALVQADGLGRRSYEKVAVEGFAACGTPAEALRYHGLDGASLAERVLARVDRRNA